MITRSDIRSFPSLREKENDYTHQLNTFHHKLQEIAKTGRTEGVVSTFEKASKSSQRALSKLIEKLDKLSEQS